MNSLGNQKNIIVQLFTNQYTVQLKKADATEQKKERKNKLVAFGSEEYSKEELIAEIGSANLMNIIGIETKKSFRNSTAYIQSWLRVLRNDNKFIVSASSKAEKAVEYILNEA